MQRLVKDERAKALQGQLTSLRSKLKGLLTEYLETFDMRQITLKCVLGTGALAEIGTFAFGWSGGY